MGMYEEIDKETMGLLLGALAERTLFNEAGYLSTAFVWKFVKY